MITGVTVVVPLSLPIVSVIVSGLLTVRLTFRASTAKKYLLALASVIDTTNCTLSIMPIKSKTPGPLVETKEPGGIVILKLPIWSVTGSVGGFIPLLLAPRVKWE